MGLILSIVGWVAFFIVVVKAFRDDVTEGLLCLLVPFYVVWYGYKYVGGWAALVLLAGVLLGPGMSVLQWAGLDLGSVMAKNDPCKLVTKADVAAALDEPVGGAKRRTVNTVFGETRTCEYVTEKAPQRGLVVMVAEKCKSLSPFKERAIERASPIQGLGDEALWDSDSLVVRKSSTCLVFGTGEEAPAGGFAGLRRLEVNKAVATKALPRLRR